MSGLRAKVIPTRHFEDRAEGRRLSRDVAEFILRYGTEFHAAGAVRITVVEKHLPTDLQGSFMARRARDWVVVLDGPALLTCYRRKDATRYLRHIPPWRRDWSRAA